MWRINVKRFIVFILIIINILGCTVTVMADGVGDSLLPEFPELESRYIVLMDADSGEVLYQKNGNAKCYPASTTKLLTALLTIENSSLSETVTYSKAAVDSITYGDANASISEGEELTVEQSLYCLLLRSANDVAYGLGEYVGGTISNFSSMMNDRAASLGAMGTHFTNTSGLTDEFHYTTPYDMALIGCACFNNKTLMNILSYSGVYTIGKTNKSNFTRYYTHRYQMIKGGDYEYEYSKGGKTGYTDAAGNCLVSFAEKDGVRLVCSIMNSSDAGRYKDTIALFDYYFNNYSKIYLDDYSNALSFGIDVLDLTSSIGSTGNLSIGFEDDAYLLAPKKVDASDLKSIVTYADSAAYAGKDGGFACISFYYNGTGVGNATVYVRKNNSDVIPGTNGVMPFNNTLSVNNDKIIYINVFFIIAGVIFIAIIVALCVIKTKNNRKRHSFGTSKKLHF